MFKYKIDSWGRLVPCVNEEPLRQQPTTCPEKNRDRLAGQGPSRPRKRRVKKSKKIRNIRHRCNCRCNCCRRRRTN
ncbi:hypothetical protein DFP94_106201 [Fontibacillus phaseoli]|uniref:Uncharacterized protein n=1 Tax=Fontibacillus phaseoli TaxID=1416533 RepID=A0A369BDX2_9BACL|nr:hypothetical protein DFP94_106201 [Fontibacillus phaseoli]